MTWIEEQEITDTIQRLAHQHLDEVIRTASRDGGLYIVSRDDLPATGIISMPPNVRIDLRKDDVFVSCIYPHRLPVLRSDDNNWDVLVAAVGILVLIALFLM